MHQTSQSCICTRLQQNRYNEILTALEQCSEEQRRNLQTQLDEHLALREQIEKNRYLLSAEDIAAWQDAMKYMVFSSPSVYDLNPNLFIDVEFRYLDGQLPGKTDLRIGSNCADDPFRKQLMPDDQGE